MIHLMDEDQVFARVISAKRSTRDTQTVHEYVRGVIRSAILSSELKSGKRLFQAELASLLDVSITPVREALRDLATEGLVRFDPRRGAAVVEMTRQDLDDIYEIRKVLEPLAMRQAIPSMTEPLLARLLELHEAMVEEPLSTDWVERNRVFHLATFEAGTSSQLAGIIRNLQDASLMFIGAALQNPPWLRDRANQDHAAILGALERRDTEAAVDAVIAHLQTPISALDRVSGGEEGVYSRESFLTDLRAVTRNG